MLPAGEPRGRSHDWSPPRPDSVRRIGQRVPISVLGIGTAPFGNMGQRTSLEESTAAVRAALDCGVRYFDTAPHYGLGLSEERLGQALTDLGSPDVVLSTKVGRLLVPNATPSGVDPGGFLVPDDLTRRWDFTRDGVLRSIEGSLRRLRVDRLDIAYLHDPDAHWDTAATTGMEALRELRDEGVVGAIGAGMNQTRMLTRFIETFDIDVVMVAGRYTLLDRSAAEDLLPAAASHHTSVIAAGVYNSGLLSRPVVDDDAWFDYRQASATHIARARAMATVCSEYGVTLPDAAAQFPLRDPAVTGVVIGARSGEHVTAADARLKAHVPEELWSDLDALAAAPLR